jgi:hypothetical protein
MGRQQELIRDLQGQIEALRARVNPASGKRK